MVNFKLKSASKRAICALCALCAAVALASCGSAQKSSSNASSAKEDTGTMRVAYLSTANYLTTLKNEKFLQEEFGKSKVTYTGPYTPVDGLTAVMSGSADATTTGTGRFIDLIAEGQPWVAFALEYYNGDSQGIVASAKSGVKSLKDLYGKKVAIIHNGDTGDYMLHRAFDKSGLDVSKVKKVEMSPKNFQAAFSSGQIDAISSFDQNLAAAMTTPGSKLLVNAKKYGNMNVTIHIVSRSFAKKHPELVKKMYKALVREAKKSHKEKNVISNAYKQLGASDTIIKQIEKFDNPTIRPIDAKGLEMMKVQAKEYVKYGLIKQAPKNLDDSVMDCSK